jgi:hypothetical protein
MHMGRQGENALHTNDKSVSDSHGLRLMQMGRNGFGREELW